MSRISFDVPGIPDQGTVESRVRRQRILHLGLIGLAVGLISTLHFSLGTTATQAHTLHVVLRSLYVLPIIGTGIWFGLRGAMVAVVVISTIYGSHVFMAWRDSLTENTSQAAMIALYVVIGVVAGGLSSLEDRQRRARERLEARMQRDLIVGGLETLSRALKWRDPETQRHSESVARLAVAVAQKLRLSREQVERLYLAARVHDIGKIGVRDDVLLKPSELSPDERRAIEKHPEVAADLLRSISGTADLASIVVAHHECPDGSGYPRGLTGDQIPTEARILRVADVYCALSEDRPYQASLERQRVLSLMRGMNGSRLDSEALQALLTVLDLEQEPVNCFEPGAPMHQKDSHGTRSASV